MSVWPCGSQTLASQHTRGQVCDIATTYEYFSMLTKPCFVGRTVDHELQNTYCFFQLEVHRSKNLQILQRGVSGVGVSGVVQRR